MKGAAAAIQYIVDMGPTVMLPVMIAVLSLILGVRIGKAVRAGLMIGVGFVGMNLIVDMMSDSMGPAAQAMAQRLGVSLSIVEVGWPGMSAVTWSSVLATVTIPLSIALNVVMLALKLTKTINMDIWNVWHMTFTGAAAYAVTGNIWIGLLGVAVHAVLSFKLGDLWAPVIAGYFELEGITTPHGTAAYMGPVACLVDRVIERIPGVRKIHLTIGDLQEKIGVLGEPVVIGFILGSVIGFLSGQSLQEALPLGIKMAAVMVLMPRMVKCIMEGLFPLSERMKELLQKRFGEDASFYIGLDPSLLLGDPEVVTAGILFVPITLLIALVIPGNRVLPFGDLATIGFFISIAVAVHKGNLFRTLISGSCIMAMTIWITNQTVAWTTALGRQTGSVHGDAVLAAMDQGGCPITYIFTQIFTRENIIGLLVIAAIYGLSWYSAVRYSEKTAQERKRDAQQQE